VGLITYMRTDSLRISNEAQREAIAYLNAEYGKEYVAPRQYKSKKNSQDAHEAIRPTSININPIHIKDKLTNDQFKLYKLIWERFAASQMAASVHNSVSATLTCGSHTFKATGSEVIFKGYMMVYVEGSDNTPEKDKTLPKLTENKAVTLDAIDSMQHFTKPPARYTEASLVHTLEENGIGRPSTYAPTITTIVSRGYVRKVKKQLVPTELGMITTDIMKKSFDEIVDVDFTADMEQKLDNVEDGKLDWVQVLSEFYPSFSKNLEKAQKEVEKVTIKDEESDVVCEKCGRKMVYKVSKFGKFLACPGYPECRNTKAIRTEIGVKCPKCGGEILEKKSHKGNTFYGCENYPKCEFMAWDKPVKKEACPECGSLLLKRKGRNAKIYCYNEACKYERKPERKEKK
ncbi:MAG: type I DNA topoisomerase, partial [Ruminococcaceae bacterium]|nr:type I DNA topoisomerase [Oscillospiraceae bacterium]